MTTGKMRRSRLVLVLASVALASGCATLMRKASQKIPVTSNPAGAIVRVNGVPQGAAPLVLKLRRSQKDQVVRIESPGYNPFEIRMRRGSSGFALGNLLLGGLAGYLIAGRIYFQNDDTANLGTIALICIPATIGVLFLGDLASGADFEFTPANLVIMLSKADGTPHVDTLTLNEADLPNIRWIRVRSGTSE